MAVSSESSDTEPSVTIGIDTGGTHTDVVLAIRDSLYTLKVPSTLDDLTTGILSGIDGALEMAQARPSDIERFVYATTFVTNLIVEGKTAPAGLITTSGFRDVLEIGRASRKPHIYDIQWRPPPPLVPRPLRMTVRERISAAGEIIVPLDEEGARIALRALADAKVESIAICFLHAYANPEHERRMVSLAAEICPEVDISISSDVVRQFREYERSSTTVVNALIKRPLRNHLLALQDRLRANEVNAPAYIMRGNGGVSTFAKAVEAPVALTHSGPMGGIIGGTMLAKACGISNIITLDMGGTSADISLVSDGTPLLTSTSKLGPHPLMVPMLDLITIGAGGGSMAWMARGNALRVGPMSAGALPGPASYGQGGTAATVTDCNLIAGRLNPAYFLNGQRKLDVALATNALLETIAKPLGMSADEAALGVMTIAEAHMINALRLVSVERGIDARDFTLVAFGGAGPLHAIALAEALSMTRILIPPAPGNLSATGLMLADVRHDLVRTTICDLAEDAKGRVIANLQELEVEAMLHLDAEQIPAHRRRLMYSLDLRYQGQNYELNIPLSSRMLEQLENTGSSDISKQFNERHSAVYGYLLPGRAIQIVNVRATALGLMSAASWPRQPKSTRELPPAVSRPVLLPGKGRCSIPIHRFLDLRAGDRLSGPAIVEYPGSTFFVPHDWQVEFDESMIAHACRPGSIDTIGAKS